MAFGATRAKLMAENLGEHAPLDVHASARPGDLAGETKSATALAGGHEVVMLIAEVWGGFAPEAMPGMRFLGELSKVRNSVDLEHASATWSTSSFTA